MMENEARPTAGGPAHRRYCGECGTRIDQRCPKCYTAAQPEPSANLREAVETLVTTFIEFWDDRDVPQSKRREAVALALSAVGPVVEEYRDMIRRLVSVVGLLDNIICDSGIILGDKEQKEFNGCWDDAQVLIGGDDE